MNPNLMAPNHIQPDSERFEKFFLNQIDRLNNNQKGPWITKTKKSIIVKLIHFQGKSVAF